MYILTDYWFKTLYNQTRLQMIKKTHTDDNDIHNMAEGVIWVK